MDENVFHESVGDTVVLGTEMDPPGRWFRVVLDAETGREVGRERAFSVGCAGMHGVGAREGG